MYNSYYGLTFNPVDKQQLKEKDHFISKDFIRNDQLLELSQGYPGDRGVYCQTGHGKVVRSPVFCCWSESQSLPHGIPVPVHHQRG